MWWCQRLLIRYCKIRAYCACLLHTTVFNSLVSSRLPLRLGCLCHVESRTVYSIMVPSPLTTVSVESVSSGVLAALFLLLSLHPSSLWLEPPLVVILAQLSFVNLLPHQGHYCLMLLHFLLVPLCSERVGSGSYLWQSATFSSSFLPHWMLWVLSFLLLFRFLVGAR